MTVRLAQGFQGHIAVFLVDLAEEAPTPVG
jgi:hypothetical protein